MISQLANKLFKYQQEIKYLIAGGAATVFNLFLLYLFTDIFHIWYLLSASLAFIISFFVSFFLQKYWTFGSSGLYGVYTQMTKFLIVSLVNLTVNAALMFILVEAAGIWYMLAQFIASGLIAVESYLVYNFLIFKKTVSDSAPGKVLIATGIFPPDIGGPATMLKAMANALAEKGMEVKVITYADAVNYELRITNYEFEVYRIIRNQNILLRYIKYFWRVFKLALWADVIYVTDTYSAGYFAYLINKLMSKPYVVRFAGDSAWETAAGQGLTRDYIVDFQGKKYGSRVEKLKIRRTRILRSAGAVVAVSEFMKELALKIGVASQKIKVIYNAIDFMNNETVDSDKAQTIRRRYGQGAKIMATACRLTSWKGVDGLIKVLPRLVKKIGPVNFLVLGDGPELANLKKLAGELTVSQYVHFLGRINHGDILNYLAAAGAFVLNTNYEGLSHTLLEAMKAGAPIVTTDAGGNPEVIENGKTGLLVKYNDQVALLDACVKVLTDDNLAKFLIANATMTLKKFNWQETVAATAALLKEVGAGQLK